MPEQFEITNINSDMNIDFIGIKVGDVNGSVTANVTSQESEPRSDEYWTLSILDRAVQVGELVSVDINAVDTGIIYGWQYSLSSDKLNLVKVESGIAQLTSQNIYDDHRGNINVSYAKGDGHQINAGDRLYTITFQATAAGQLSEMLSLTSKGMKAEAYNENLDVTDIYIRWEGTQTQPATERAFSVEQNEPNPWVDMTSIQYYLPSEGEVTFTVRDVAGRELYRKTTYKLAGQQSEKLSGANLTSKGVLFYELQFEDKVITKKMILTQ